ncbi:MAG: GatB/YqeY domain-containing protein, partial [Parvularculaceae bacterium]|nr:GatB/YqeY domain-containing protein [Parvularculaceae bacterium]
MLRDRINDALKTAMKSGAADRVSTLRLVTSALKDRDIALRVDGKTVDDAEILTVLTKMVKQREDSATQYDAGKRPDLAAKERAE